MNQLSTAVRPDKNYKTDRLDLGGSGLDIHAAIGHHYTGPYNPIEQQLKYDPESGQILEVYQQPTGRSDAVAMQHDVDYASCEYRANTYGENKNKCKHWADKKWLNHLTQSLGAKDSGDTH